MRGYDVNKVQIPGTKIKPTRPLLDTLLEAVFGGLSLKRRKKTVITDQVLKPYIRTRSEIVEKLLNDTCEMCGAKEKVQMHHIRRLKDLDVKGKKTEGRRELPLWKKIMISRKRKSIPLCKACHENVHHNGPRTTRQGNRRAG